MSDVKSVPLAANERMKPRNGSKMDVKTPYFSLAGSAQSNPCKLVMYRSAKHVLQKSPAEIKVATLSKAKP